MGYRPGIGGGGACVDEPVDDKGEGVNMYRGIQVGRWKNVDMISAKEGGYEDSRVSCRCWILAVKGLNVGIEGVLVSVGRYSGSGCLVCSLILHLHPPLTSSAISSTSRV